MPPRIPFQKKKSASFVNDCHQDQSDDNYITSLEVNSLTMEETKWIQLKIDRMMIKMELDTGSEVSVMAEGEFHKKFNKKNLKMPHITLRTYSGKHTKPVDYIDVQVEHGDTKQTFPLLIVRKELLRGRY